MLVRDITWHYYPYDKFIIYTIEFPHIEKQRFCTEMYSRISHNSHIRKL